MVHSFAIHEVQCRELFEKREALKPPKERRACPSDPLVGRSHDLKSLDAINAASQESWSAGALAQCQNCGRKFLPEKLIIHNKSCRVDNPARRVDEPVDRRMNSKSSSNRYDFDTAEIAPNVSAGLNQCPSCGRTFNEIAYVKYVFRE